VNAGCCTRDQGVPLEVAATFIRHCGLLFRVEMLVRKLNSNAVSALIVAFLVIACLQPVDAMANELSRDVVCKVASMMTWSHFMGYTAASRAHGACRRQLGVVARVLMNTYGEKAITGAFRHGRFEVALIQALLETGADAYANDSEALLWAASRGNLSLVKMLIDHGANIHADHDLALRWAAGFGRVEVVRFLLSKGAEPNAENTEALQLSAESGHQEVVIALLGAGANVHSANDFAIRSAAVRGHAEIVKTLLDHGANGCANYNEAIIDAGIYGHLEIVAMLHQQAHCNLRARNDALIRGAARVGHIHIIRYVIEHEGPRSILRTPNMALENAIKHLRIDVVRYLLERGVNLSAEGINPYEFAVKNNADTILDLMLSHHAPGSTELKHLMMIGIRQGTNQSTELLARRYPELIRQDVVCAAKNYRRDDLLAVFEAIRLPSAADKVSSACNRLLHRVKISSSSKS
jgi:ankyrin repeat protein